MRSGELLEILTSRLVVGSVSLTLESEGLSAYRFVFKEYEKTLYISSTAIALTKDLHGIADSLLSQWKETLS